MWQQKGQSCNTAGFEGEGRGLWTKECGGPLEARNVKETDSPLESPGRNAVHLNPVRPMLDF